MKPVVNTKTRQSSPTQRRTVGPELVDRNGNTPLHLIATSLTSPPQEMVDFYAVPSVINTQNRNGATPLYLASSRGNESMVRTLLRNGASPNIAENYLFTPLHIAYQADHLNIVALLLEAGADPTALTRDGDPPNNFARNNSKNNLISEYIFQLMLILGATMLGYYLISSESR